MTATALTVSEIIALPIGTILRCELDGRRYFGELRKEKYQGHDLYRFEAPPSPFIGTPHFGLDRAAFFVDTLEGLRAYAEAGFDAPTPRWTLGECGMSHPTEWVPAPIRAAGSIMITPRGTHHYVFEVLDVQPHVQYKNWESANLGAIQVPVRNFKYLVARKTGGEYLESQGQDPGAIWVDGRGEAV